MWLTGNGKKISFEEILSIIKEYTKKGANVYIGCDSQKSRTDCVFATSICLHGAKEQSGGIYFYKRNSKLADEFPTIMLRVLHEVEMTINLGNLLTEEIPNINIELHLDINPKESAYTNKFVNMLAGYTRGSGFKYKLKPESWASSSVADKHSK